MMGQFLCLSLHVMISGITITDLQSDMDRGIILKMKTAIRLFLSLLIVALSFVAQEPVVFSDDLSSSLTVSSIVVTSIPDCGEAGSVGHPCHFGHLGGCAPIESGEVNCSFKNVNTTMFTSKNIHYSSPSMDSIERPPIFS